MEGQAVTFGPFTFNRTSQLLMRDAEPVAIGGRGAALLVALLDANGGIVTKTALMEAAWPGTTVEERNLTVQVAALRKAMGRAPDGQDWIRTIARVGYRLVRDPPQPAMPTGGKPSVVVLPFLNLSSDPEQGYFADGIVEDLITALSRFKSFAVVARNSAFLYKGRAVDVRQVARDLSIRYVVEGSVRRSGDQVRVSAQLIDASDGAHLWAEHFDGRLGDIFDVQDRITEAVVGMIAPQISRAEIEHARSRPAGSLGLYDLCTLVAAYAHLGRMDEARATLDALLELRPDLTIAELRRESLGFTQSRADDWLAGMRLAGLPDGD